MKSFLAFSGSSRSGSLNHALLNVAASYVEHQGAVVEQIDLRELGLPLYDGDLEAAQGLPPGVSTLKHAMTEADGFIITSPEYNSFPTPLLLNAIDWASRPESKDEAPLSCFRGKTAALLAASPGPMGGIRSLWALRTKLENIGVTIVPSVAAVGGVTVDDFQRDDFTSSRDGKRMKSTLDALLRLEV
jgi:NAD(P)H-dependent FMN reductase